MGKEFDMHDTHDYADASKWRGTTILTVRKNGKVIVIGDGQVTIYLQSEARYRTHRYMGERNFLPKDH